MESSKLSLYVYILDSHVVQVRSILGYCASIQVFWGIEEGRGFPEQSLSVMSSWFAQNII
jgi:hypothetical protein